MKENPIRSLPGIPVFMVLLGLLLVAAWLILGALKGPDVARLFVAVPLGVVALFFMFGLYMIEPNQAAVVSLFGRYVGTVKDNGLRWNNPLCAKRRISQRVRNFESGKLKVNELDGSPIEIGSRLPP